MGSNGAIEISKGDGCQGSETTIEIKIKTLDSQIYTLRVNKQMPVPALKEQIASVTGVLSEQQRLICRGRVLKDDQLLSAYHVEDGHTLHMVVGQPAPPSSGSVHSHPASDPASSTSHGQRIQVAPGVVVETFDITDQGDGVLPDINRIVSAVLGAFGINSTGGGNEGVDGQARDSGGHERMFSSSGMTASTPLQTEQAGLTGQSDRPHGAFGLPTASSLGPFQPRVIPDSLTTLTQYLSHMRQEYGGNGGNNSHDAAIRGIQSRESISASPSLPVQERLPTPELLAEVLLSTRELLMEQTAECLLQLGRELHNQSNVTDPIVRLSTQSNAWRSGTLFQNLGAFLLELGRATMTLRMGQTSSEAVVSAGPAVFISQSGPNPLMVQPLPFQPGTSFGVIPPSTGQHGSGLGNDSGAGFVPRRIDIQIRRGSSAVRENVNQEEHGGETLVNQVTPAASEGLSRPTQSGVRLVPVRTMLAAIPGQLGRLPGLGRFQHIASGHLSGRRGFQAFGEQHANGLHTELHPIPESGVQQNTENRASDNSTNAAAEQGSLPPPNSRRFRFSVLSTGATENQQAEREVPSEVFQVLRSLFPAGEIHVEDAGSQRTGTGPVTDNAGTTSTAMDAPEAEHRVSDEGIFFSNVLRQIMPFISQLPGAPPDVSTEPAYASEQRTAHESSIEAENSDVGTSRQQSDVQPIPPNSKRQKME